MVDIVAAAFAAVVDPVVDDDGRQGGLDGPVLVLVLVLVLLLTLPVNSSGGTAACVRGGDEQQGVLPVLVETVTLHGGDLWLPTSAWWRLTTGCCERAFMSLRAAINWS